MHSFVTWVGVSCCAYKFENSNTCFMTYGMKRLPEFGTNLTAVSIGLQRVFVHVNVLSATDFDLQKLPRGLTVS